MNILKNRNILLNSEFSLKLPNPYPHPMEHPNGCEKCGQKNICMDVCRIVQFEHCDSTCFKHPDNPQIPTSCSLKTGIEGNIPAQFKNWINIGKFGNVSGSANKKLSKFLIRSSILNILHPFQTFILGQKNMAPKIAKNFASDMLKKGIYVIAFSYPVVPQGEARIRVQISASHSKNQLNEAINAFKYYGKKYKII